VLKRQGREPAVLSIEKWIGNVRGTANPTAGEFEKGLLEFHCGFHREDFDAPAEFCRHPLRVGGPSK
jgi:hypothetical protein